MSLLKTALSAFIFFLLSLGFAETSQEALELLYRTRYAIYLEDSELEGYLRKDREKTPVNFAFKKGVVTMKFQPKGKTNWLLGIDVKEATPSLWFVESGETQAIEPDEYGQKIEGTDFSVEDLAMRFLYWPEAEFLGEESVKGQNTKIVRVKNPNEVGLYKWVDVWIIPESGTLMQMEAYNWESKKVTRYRILNVMKIKGKYHLEKLKIESLKPESGKVDSYSYLQFEKPYQSKISRIKALR